MADPHKVHSCTLSLTSRELITSMPIDYQPPKFQSFDGKRNLKQHVTHFNLQQCKYKAWPLDQIICLIPPRDCLWLVYQS